MVTPKEIGKIFAEKREELKLSVEETYRRSRIHPRVIRDIESGVFDRLGKTYLKSFLKKYAVFLGLDAEHIVREYESISAAIPDREFNLDIERGEEKGEIFTAPGKRRLQAALAAAFSVIFLILFFMFIIGTIRSRTLSARREEHMATAEKKTESAIIKKEAVHRQTQRESTYPAGHISRSSRKGTSVTLILKARGRVWVQVTKGEDIVFVGVLEKGDSRTWESDGTLTVWTGKADMLDFVVNGRRIGKVAAGVVRNIKVSAGGVKIGNVWITHLE